MKTKYRFIHFETLSDDTLAKMDVEKVTQLREPLNCLSNKTQCVLGRVEYFTPWRQWVIAPWEDCVWNTTCLADLMHFLGQLNEANQ